MKSFDLKTVEKASATKVVAGQIKADKAKMGWTKLFSANGKHNFMVRQDPKNRSDI